MKSYHLLLLSNHSLRVFFLLYAISITIDTVRAGDTHDDTTIENFENRNSNNHDTDNYHQSVNAVTKNGVSEKVEKLITDEGFILNVFKQQQQQQRPQQEQQNENEEVVNNDGNFENVIAASTNKTINSKEQQNLSFAGTNFIDFSLIYPANKKIPTAIFSISNNSKSIDLSDINDDAISNDDIQWRNLYRIRENLNNHDNNRKKRWAIENDDDLNQINELIETLTSSNHNSPTIASDEIMTSSDYQINDADADTSNSERDRFQIPMENIVIVGSDADDDEEDVDQIEDRDGDDDNGNHNIFKDTTFDDAETTDSYEHVNSIEDTGKDDENVETGIVRIAPEMLPKDSMEEMESQYVTKMEPTVHYTELRSDDEAKSTEIIEAMKTEEKQFDELEKLKEIMDEKLLKIDQYQTKNHFPHEDEIDLGTIQEMRISDDPNDASIACDDETEGSGLQDEEELQEYGKPDKTTTVVPESSSMHASLEYPRDDHNPSSSSYSSSSSSSCSPYPDNNVQFIVGKHTDSLILPFCETTSSVIPRVVPVQLSEGKPDIDDRVYHTGGLAFVEGSCCSSMIMIDANACSLYYFSYSSFFFLFVVENI
uniref:Syndecan n=1 Tax=Elaeophora elaphi TaxID=1147741 RepID=A0A0R3RKQ6_9BILA